MTDSIELHKNIEISSEGFKKFVKIHKILGKWSENKSNEELVSASGR